MYCVYMCIQCMCICMYSMCMYVCIYMYTCVYTICVCVYVICMYVCVCTVYICIHCVCMYVCLLICVYMYIHSTVSNTIIKESITILFYLINKLFFYLKKYFDNIIFNLKIYFYSDNYIHFRKKVSRNETQCGECENKSRAGVTKNF